MRYLFSLLNGAHDRENRLNILSFPNILRGPSSKVNVAGPTNKRPEEAGEHNQPTNQED